MISNNYFCNQMMLYFHLKFKKSPIFLFIFIFIGSTFQYFAPLNLYVLSPEYLFIFFISFNLFSILIIFQHYFEYILLNHLFLFYNFLQLMHYLMLNLYYFQYKPFLSSRYELLTKNSSIYFFNFKSLYASSLS